MRWRPWRVLADTKGWAAAVAAVVLGFAALDVATGLAGPPTTGPAGPYAATALQLCVDLSLLLLLRAPTLVGGITAAAALAMLGSDVFAPGLLVPEDPVVLATVPSATPVVVAAVVRLGDRRSAIVLVAVLAAVATRPWEPAWDTLPFGLLNTAGAALLSLYLQARADLLRSLRERAERAERERHLLARQARAEERRRLAMEMHDTVSHQVSLIVLQAGALGVTTGEPGTRAAADSIRAAGTRAIAELRGILGVLRDEPLSPERPAQQRPGGAGQAPEAPDSPDGPDAPPDPADLVGEARAAGLDVGATAAGDPSRASPVIARAVYRVVQEALTNARKHAHGAPATVELHYGEDGVRVEVRNAAAERAPDPLLSGGGTAAGLTGLRHRVELVGGSLHAGPEPGGGFTVRALMPLNAPESDTDTAEGTAR